MKKVLVFFPHNLYPPRYGGQRRGLEVLAGLREAGYETTLVSSTLSSDTEWTASSVQSLKDGFVKDVRIHQATQGDHEFVNNLREFYSTGYGLPELGKKLRLLGKLLSDKPPPKEMLSAAINSRPPVNSMLHTPPGMRRWFGKVFHEVQPDVVIMNYAGWDGLLNNSGSESVLRVIDTLDLVSLNNAMQRAVIERLPTPLRAELTDEQVLSEDFFEKLDLATDIEEFRIFDRYDYTIAITSREVDLIKRHTFKTKVSLIPATFEPCPLQNSYSESALFPVGPNYFNLQGYLYFVKRVLPQVLRKIPSFLLRVTGAFPGEAPETATGVELTGFVPSLKPFYERSRFLICPVFGGTGQQLKIPEAMAHGLPAIALRRAAEGSPIEHGVNGLVADDADEFAQHVIQLWEDQPLCRQLGTAARATIAAEVSQSRLVEELNIMLR